MATVTITKVSVKEAQLGLWLITLNLKYLDGTTELIKQDFSIRYRPGQKLSDILPRVKGEMQGTIDAYKREQVILNTAALNTAITNLQSSLQV